MRLLGAKPGDLIEGATIPCRQRCAWRSRELLTGGLAFQTRQSLPLAWGKQRGHVEHLSVRQRHRVDHPTIDSDRWAKVSGNHGGGFFDTEYGMPAKRTFDQPSPSYPAWAVLRDPWQGTSPPGTNASDKGDGQRAPAVVQTSDVQCGSLRDIDS
jgi:hypothetical protein